jgi:hypothetical protein
VTIHFSPVLSRNELAIGLYSRRWENHTHRWLPRPPGEPSSLFPLLPVTCSPRSGTPGRIRTCGLLLRRQTLYPSELQAHADKVYSRPSLRSSWPGQAARWLRTVYRVSIRDSSRLRVSNPCGVREG